MTGEFVRSKKGGASGAVRAKGRAMGWARQWFPLLGVGVVLLVATVSNGRADNLKRKVLPVLSTSDAVGSVKPCGCHTPKGGLARIASLVDSTKIQYGDALVVEAGDFAPDASKPHEASRLDFQFGMMNLIGYDAIGVGERELAFGYERLAGIAAKSKTPVISTNLIDKATGKPAFRPYVIVPKGNLKVGVFSLLSPKIDLGASATPLLVEDPVATAQKTVAELRKKADVVVLLAHVGRVEGEDLAAQVPGIDVVILAHHPGFVAQGRKVNEAITVASGEQIQNMGVTLVQLDGKKVANLSSETKILLPEVGERGDIARLVKDFEDRQNEELKREQANALKSSNVSQ
ncbi:MAG: hypothetical protein ACREOU_00960 [Candidatus Eiseniibacteriota bacterium]